MKVAETLSERERTHGDYSSLAALSQALKTILHNTDGWERLTPEMRESFEMIVVKMCRILNGDPKHFDSWHDIEGYAKLIADQLQAIAKENT